MPNNYQYPRWRLTRDNEDFDRASQLAAGLAKADRLAGKPAPDNGYDAERFTFAWTMVKLAQY